MTAGMTLLSFTPYLLNFRQKSNLPKNPKKKKNQNALYKPLHMFVSAVLRV